MITLVAFHQRQFALPRTLAFIGAQVAGCCAGAMLANLMFELPAIHASTHGRAGGAQWLSEVVATAGLVYIAFSSPSISTAAWRVPAWIGAAYWFTASTSFANPAITIGRSISDTFAGIRPSDAPGFIAAQLAGGFVGVMLLRFFAERRIPA
jgi:arsenate reductase